MRAYIWFNIGAYNGNTNSAANRERITEVMTPAQIASALGQVTFGAVKHTYGVVGIHILGKEYPLVNRPVPSLALPEFGFANPPLCSAIIEL